ncbi:TetR/AcrR family transcriptional regulator [uncultured Jannaschia sp.]|uniref:TetR/AcrR family transcriptional regulator n=1 Tax=uncultured Jannaschia sp. TaxID=293347 RepID=UPI00260CDCC8|nr:TetR/AcrR family transcriptional regulator [uncultured Jannaschia sp.]
MSRRDALLPLLAEQMLTHGLDMPLRPLADAVGTSDRMLLYYFETREELVAAVLGHLGQAFTQRLATAHPGGPAPSLHALSGLILDVARDPALTRTVRVWFSLLSDPARRPLAAGIIAGYHEWLATALPDGADPDAADALLAFVEGAIVLDAAGQSDRVDRARAVLFPPPDAG